MLVYATVKTREAHRAPHLPRRAQDRLRGANARRRLYRDDHDSQRRAATCNAVCFGLAVIFCRLRDFSLATARAIPVAVCTTYRPVSTEACWRGTSPGTHLVSSAGKWKAIYPAPHASIADAPAMRTLPCEGARNISACTGWKARTPDACACTGGGAYQASTRPETSADMCVE